MQEERSSHEQLKIERYLWIARAFSAVAVLSVVANMLLLFAIASLYPLVRVRPYYMTVLDKNQQVVEITPITVEEMNNKEVIESLIRQYVLARYTITQDIDELKERWSSGGIVYLMSSQDVFKTFEEKHVYGDKDEGRVGELEMAEKEGLITNVRIDSIVPMEGKKSINWWTVKLRLKMQMQSSVEPEEVERTDVLEVVFDPLNKKSNIVTWQDRLKNPLGFRVINYGTE